MSEASPTTATNIREAEQLIRDQITFQFVEDYNEQLGIHNEMWVVRRGKSHSLICERHLSRVTDDCAVQWYVAAVYEVHRVLRKGERRGYRGGQFSILWRPNRTRKREVTDKQTRQRVVRCVRLIWAFAGI